MGDLATFNLYDYIIKHNTYTYFETGTGIGDTLAQAMTYPFDKFYTVDIDDEILGRAKDRIGTHDHVTYINAKSTDALKEFVPQLPADEPVLWFLDAHFPGADYEKISYEESLKQYMWDAFPLEEEINIIKSMRDTSNDVFIIDDFILYETGDYDTIRQGVVWRYGWLQDELGLQTNSDFLYNAFSESHNFVKTLKQQGHLIITPKDAS